MEYQFGLTMVAFFTALAAMVGSIAAAIFAINAVIDVKALQKSTHTMMTNMKPAEEFFSDTDEQEVLDAITKAEDQFNGLRGVENEHDII